MSHFLTQGTNLLTDQEAPTINPCPDDIKIISPGNSHKLVLPAVTVADNVGVDSFKTNPPNGSEVTWGEYNITYTALDKAKNKAYCKFRITIAGMYISDRLDFSEIGSEKDKEETLTLKTPPDSLPPCERTLDVQILIFRCFKFWS